MFGYKRYRGKEKLNSYQAKIAEIEATGTNNVIKVASLQTGVATALLVNGVEPDGCYRMEYTSDVSEGTEVRLFFNSKVDLQTVANTVKLIKKDQDVRIIKGEDGLDIGMLDISTLGQKVKSFEEKEITDAKN